MFAFIKNNQHVRTGLITVVVIYTMALIQLGAARIGGPELFFSTTFMWLLEIVARGIELVTAWVVLLVLVGSIPGLIEAGLGWLYKKLGIGQRDPSL